MQIQKLRVVNYRAIHDAEMVVTPVTAIIGENNSGKSAFLRAIDLFFDSAPKLKPEDFHNRQVNESIEITITFGDLTPDERTAYGAKIVDGTMTVTRELTIGGGKSYLVSALGSEAFAEVRNEQGKSDKLRCYRELRKNFELPAAGNSDDIEGHLAAWEEANPESLTPMRQSGFFGADNVASGKLKSKTEFIFVPAIKNVRDELDGRGSPVRTLLSGIAKQAIENSDDYKNFIVESEQKIKELTSPENAPQLKDISAQLTNIMQRYYADAALKASWDEVTGLPVSLPTPDVKVMDGTHIIDVDYVGHGMQRAIILNLLEYIAQNSYSSIGDFTEAASDIIIAIEEPELFQHPTKQRLFFQALSKIAIKFNQETGIRIQVIYATHSPLLVSLPRAHEVKRVSRVRDGDLMRVKVDQTSLQICAERTAELREFKEADVERFKLNLHVFTSDIAEGFFGKRVILVEGVSDVAMVEAFYRSKDRDTLAEGIVIKATDGKYKLDKGVLMLTALGVPTYLVFDNDKSDTKAGEAESVSSWNQYLCKLCNAEKEEITDWPEGAFRSFAAWDGTIEKYIRHQAGDEAYEEALNKVATSMDLKPSECMKSPAVASSMLVHLMNIGIEFPLLNEIEANVDALN